MNRKRPGLGKGLDALIPMGEGFQSVKPSSGITEIPINKISPNPRQPRVNFGAEELTDLAESIKEHGIIQPLIVKAGVKTDSFILIAGERRLMAAKEAGLSSVPVIQRETTEQEQLEIALIENVQRADLSPLETAEAYRQLAEDFSLSHESIGSRVGKSRVSVTNTLRLLNLPPSVQLAINNLDIREGHARALLALPTSQAQAAALKTIIDKGLSVRQTEALVRKLTGEKPEQNLKQETPPEIKALEESLRSSLGTKVNLKHGRKGGTITIHFYSDEELESLLGILTKDD